MRGGARSILLFSLSALLVGCTHYQESCFRVVNSRSGAPVAGAKLSTDFVDGFSITYLDLIRPEWSYTQKQESTTGADGAAKMKVPLGHATGLSLSSPEGKPTDAQDFIGTTVTVRKNGFKDFSLCYTNHEWKRVGSRSTVTHPITIPLQPK